MYDESVHMIAYYVPFVTGNTHATNMLPKGCRDTQSALTFCQALV